ncbi:hypothetical protein FOA52_004075 [Chlamydomonas sp. UWO 241]|nr:hypothetical protein FOA52_004075 [Chlamydomonas sp. UWO 241]
MLAASAWRCMGARLPTPPGCPPRSSLLAAHAGIRRPAAGLGGPMLTRAPDSGGGGGAHVAQQLRRPGDKRRDSKTSRFHGVTRNKASKSWQVELYNPQTKRNEHIGRYASEVDAARAYDCAAVKLLGLGYTKRNFPVEVISEPPATVRGRKSSRFTGVSWKRNRSVWLAQLWNPHTKRMQAIRTYDSEEAAAMAYDCAALELHGRDWPKLNFPGEVITKAPESRAAMQEGHAEGGEPAGRKSSCYKGISWHKRDFVRLVRLQSKHIGGYTLELDAARAYDCAAVKLLGLYTERNFRDEVISEMPATKDDECRESKTSRFHGVTRNKGSSSWMVHLRNPDTKRKQTIGRYTSEVDAARAYDCAAVKLLGLGTNRNFPAEVISEPPATMRGKKSSRFTGVSWKSDRSVWQAYLRDPQTKRQKKIGTFDSEEAAATAYDCAAVQLHGPDWPKLNFPG